jgi:hypothetical protein
VSSHLELGGRRIVQSRVNRLRIVLELQPLRDVGHGIWAIHIVGIIDVK